MAFGVKDNGFSYFLAFFYAQVVGLPAQTVGFAIMIALILDAFIDPIVGQLSDNTRSKWGRRHPWMYAAAIPVAVSYLLIWHPPTDWSQGAQVAYLVAVAVLIRSFISCYEIPSAALAAELTTEYDERTRLLSYRYLFGWAGGLAMYGLALCGVPEADGRVSGRPAQPARAMRNYGIFAGGLMLFAILVTSIGTHRQIPYLRDPPQRAHHPRPPGARDVRHAQQPQLRDDPGLGLLPLCGHRPGLRHQPLLLDLLLGVQRRRDRAVQLLQPDRRHPGLPDRPAPGPALREASRRHAADPGRASPSGSAPIVLRLLGAFPANESPVIFTTIFITNIFSVGLGIIANILFSSMIADVVEDAELKTGRRQEGLFFAAIAFAAKSTTGLGIFAAGLIVGAIRFPTGAKPGTIDPEIIRNLGLVYVPTQIVLYGRPRRSSWATASAAPATARPCASSPPRPTWRRSGASGIDRAPQLRNVARRPALAGDERSPIPHRADEIRGIHRPSGGLPDRRRLCGRLGPVGAGNPRLARPAPTIATWLMTLFIQRAAHRDTQALQGKLDELLRAHGDARTELAGLDQQEPEEIEAHRAQAQRDRP